MSQSTTSSWVWCTVCEYRHVTKHYKQLGLVYCLWVQTCHKALQAAGSGVLSVSIDMSQTTTSSWVCVLSVGTNMSQSTTNSWVCVLSVGTDMSQSTTNSWVWCTVCGYRHVTKHYKQLGLVYCLWVETCHKALQAAGSVYCL